MSTIYVTPSVGSQAPSYSTQLVYSDNDWQDCIDLVTEYGGAPDTWQTLPLEAWLARRPNGLWAYTKNGLSVPRQNGKNYALEARELYGLYVLEERILHTAHEVRTSKAHFKRMCKYFEDVPDLKKLVKSISKTNGEEAIYLTNGAELRFVSRSKRAARGFSSDLLVIDEAQELDSESYEAILPIISASPNPQQILTGTPPGPKASGEVFTKLRNNGIDDTAIRLSWFEWSADKGCDLDSEESWAQANPGYPHRISKETIEDERDSFVDDASFARERLGMWSDVAASTVLDMEQWETLVNHIAPEDPIAFAIDVAPDRSTASIAIAGYVKWMDPDLLRNPNREIVDAVHIEVAYTGKGTGWIVDKMVKYKNSYGPCVVMVDEKANNGELILDLKRAGVKATTISGPDVSGSWGTFMDRFNNRTLVHADMPLLDTALLNAKTRPVLSGYAWDRKNPHADITPLIAVTFAAYGLVQKRKPHQRVDNPSGQEPMMFL